MTPEERFTRLETNLERLEERIDALAVQHEKSEHDFNLRLQRLSELQVVLMEAQTDTWRALNTLSANVDKLFRLRGGNGNQT